MLRLCFVVVIALVAGAAKFAAAQDAESIRANYSKRELRIPMRDGVRLFTAVYTPKDASRAYPVLFFRTQSGILPYGEQNFPALLGPSPYFARSGYIFVYQDIRGRYMSEGEFIVLRPHKSVATGAVTGPREVDESTDTFDTIDWILKHVPGHNGKVGSYGTSYRGWLAAAGAIDAHPALVAVSPQAPIGDTFAGDDWHHNGALVLNHTFFYAPRKGRPGPDLYNVAPPARDYGTPDGYDFFLRLGPISNVNTKYFKHEVPYWDLVAAHPNYDDYWKSLLLAPHLKNLRPAMLMVGGWFDAEDVYGTLLTYDAVERQNPGNKNTLVMGPWVHGGWNDLKVDGSRLGNVSFDEPTAAWYREQVEFPFFEHHLKNSGSYQPPEALVFETGANRWHELPVWPPRETTPYELYLHAGGKLVEQPPKDGEPKVTSLPYDRYASDPAKPVSYTEKNSFRLNADYVTEDQRFAARRPDVLVYETEPLREDVTLAGPITADLRVSTDGTDSDWVVKIIDVYPPDASSGSAATTPGKPATNPTPNPAGLAMGGYQQLVRGDVMRGKFRESLETPKPFTPNEPTVVKFKMPDVFHTFKKGHRVMVQVQSTWFPLIDRNPQTFVNIFEAKESDFRSAVQRVYRSQSLPSRISASRLP